ncbi:two-component sensor histidine kinase [Rhizocola hellebori]|uniref:histidine kinase n=1 Tax=Rhizocola hellebori TaxID=1392758 RepID=A0A8J3QKI7_9ACTN|nr:histidine kinase [Rhizocola hellebori]GIH11464.1 two-component sensor histidine kinase [Rhizocola hellebori]
MEQQLGAAAVNWVTRITRRITPVVLGLLVFFLAITSPGDWVSTSISDPYGDGGPDMVVISAFAVLCGIVAAVARRWRWPLFTVAAIGWIFLTVYPTVMVSSYYAGTHLTRRRHAIAFLVGAVSLVAVPILIGFSLDDAADIGIFVAVIAVAMFVVLPYAIGLWVNARRQVIAGLQERATRLETEHAARADQARAEERARIAREMHDVVAHRVALMVLHAGALEVNAPDERLANGAALIRTTGREALTELRQVLGVLRANGYEDLTPQPDLSDLPRLLEQTRAAGLPVSFTEEGTERPLPLVVQRAAYRVVQEGLTNVVKHTGGAETSVTLRYLQRNIEVKVENGPPGAGDRMPGSGLGLIGLRERVALLYGRFEARPRLDGGYCVSAVLPDEAREVPA